MLGYKRYAVFLLIFIMILGITLTIGCSSKSPIDSHISITPDPILATTAEVIKPEIQEILIKTISAMNTITSFKLDSDVIDTYSINATYPSTQSINEWKGTKSINISDREMQINMTIETDVSSRGIKKDSTSFEMFFFQGWEYLDILLPESYSGWSKTRQYDNWWEPELQIPNLVELLNTAKTASLAGNEIVDGIDCFVLNLTPDVTSTSNWIYSQYQPIGPAKISSGGPLVSYDDKNNEGVSLKIWISNDDYLIRKVEVNALFAGILNNVGGIPVSPRKTNQIDKAEFTDKIYGQMNFLEYNQPMVIQLPTGALNAKER